MRDDRDDLRALDRLPTKDDLRHVVAVTTCGAAALIVAFVAGLVLGQINAEDQCRHRAAQTIAGDQL